MSAYKKAKDVIFNQWIKENRYKELISCAHGGWFSYDEFTKPLAEYFVKESKLAYIKFLCEKEIRFKIEDTLKCMKNVEEDCPETTWEEVISYDIEKYLKSKSYHPVGELTCLRAKSLILLNRYIELLKQTNDSEYLKIINDLKGKVQKLTIKKSDLKYIKYKLK